MPLKLVSPKPGRTPFYWVRGTYLGCYVERSTGTSHRRLAEQIRKRTERDIERGALAEPKGHGFAAAATAYMRAGGDPRFLAPLIRSFQHTPILHIDQVAIDNAAASLYPDASAATLNRQVYTPISAVLKRAGIERQIKRPKGWRGRRLTTWLSPEQAIAAFKATDLISAPAATRAEFRILLIVLLYTGMRLGDSLKELVWERVELPPPNGPEKSGTVYLPVTKSGEPRQVHLPPIVVAALEQHPRGVQRHGRVFRFHDGGRLRDMFDMTMERAGIILPPRVAFHVFCHTYGTWMRRYGGLDTHDLVKTGRWADAGSADRYAHVVVHEMARRADLLPIAADLLPLGGARRKAG